EARRLAEMDGEKGKELANVALIGLERRGGEPPLRRQMRTPASDRLQEVGGGGHERGGGRHEALHPATVTGRLTAVAGYRASVAWAGASHFPRDWPVFLQSARNMSMPLSVSGWLMSPRRTAGGTVATS